MPELRDLPSIERLLSDPELAGTLEAFGRDAVVGGLRSLQAGMRRTKAVPEWAASAGGYALALNASLKVQGYRPVFNLTGTLIHTNLGRAPLAPKVWAAMADIAQRPADLEFDLQTGRRGQREARLANQLASITGAEAACIVNNNAAALLIVLNELGLNKDVAVSRGELIEIGGSFRLPELMERSGANMVEVGTTNRTHVVDYERVAPTAALLLKVHPSNYHVEGFTKSVNVAELKQVGRAHDVPVCIDLGSGTLVDLAQFGLPHEPTAKEVLAAGADLVTFSGDKLLGSVQAGIIVGKRTLIERINKNPLKRALRCDKLTLAALSETLKLYAHPEQLPEHLPVIRNMTLPMETLLARADAVQQALPLSSAFQVTAIETSAQIGSGALPDQRINSLSVAIRHEDTRQLEALMRALRGLPTPVIGRLHQGQVLLDMRGAEPLDELLSSLQALTEP